MITPTENNMTPQETVDALDRYIIGQTDAKKAVAIALRNRWRRLQLGEDLKDEILPKNIIELGMNYLLVQQITSLTPQIYLGNNQR